MKKFFIALTLTALSGSAGAFELQNVGAAALRGAAVPELPAVNSPAVADRGLDSRAAAAVSPEVLPAPEGKRGLEDDMPHGSIPGAPVFPRIIPEDMRVATVRGQIHPSNFYASRSEAQREMEEWLTLLRYAGVQPTNYGISTVNGYGHRFIIGYHQSVPLVHELVQVHWQEAEARKIAKSAIAEYERAGVKVVTAVITRTSSGQFGVWIYYLIPSDRGLVSMPGVDEAELREGWADLKASYDKSAIPGELGALSGEYECVLYIPGEEYTEVEKLLVKILPEGNGATVIFPMPPYGEKAGFPLTLGAEGAGFDGNGDGRPDLALRLNKGGWLNLKTDLYGKNTYGFMRKIWD